MDRPAEESAPDRQSNSPPKGHEEVAAAASVRLIHDEHDDFLGDTASTRTISAYDEELIDEPISVSNLPRGLLIFAKANKLL